MKNVEHDWKTQRAYHVCCWRCMNGLRIMWTDEEGAGMLFVLNGIV